MLDLAIIGGGLSGLSLALHMQRPAYDVRLFEAASRLGGRIVSREPGGEPISGLRYDLGPSWIWPYSQPLLAAFVEHYAIPLFTQWHDGYSLYHSERQGQPQPFSDHSSYADARRLQGGSYTLIETLLQHLPSATLCIDHRLLQVIDQRDHVELRFATADGEREVRAKKVALTPPPRLLIDTVQFSPELDRPLCELMRDTSTWMAGHAKAVIRYRSPFWREHDLSGNAFCTYPGATLSEIFDASPAHGEAGVLAGFFGLPPALRREYRDELDALIIDQLIRLFGEPAANAEEIVIQDWFTEPLTATPADAVPLTQHPHYGHRWLQLDHWNDKLYFGGTETAAQFGGYLEGALDAAQRVARQLSC